MGLLGPLVDQFSNSTVNLGCMSHATSTWWHRLGRARLWGDYSIWSIILRKRLILHLSTVQTQSRLTSSLHTGSTVPEVCMLPVQYTTSSYFNTLVVVHSWYRQVSYCAVHTLCTYQYTYCIFCPFPKWLQPTGTDHSSFLPWYKYW